MPVVSTIKSKAERRVEKKVTQLYEDGKLSTPILLLLQAWEDTGRILEELPNKKFGKQLSVVATIMSDQYVTLTDKTKMMWQMRSENLNEDIYEWPAKDCSVVWTTRDGSRKNMKLTEPENCGGFLDNLGKIFREYREQLGDQPWSAPIDNKMMFTHKMVMAASDPKTGKCHFNFLSRAYDVEKGNPNFFIVCVTNMGLSIVEPEEGMQTFGVDVFDPSTNNFNMHDFVTEATGKTIKEQHQETKEERAEHLAQGRAVLESLGPDCLEKVKNRALIMMVPVERKTPEELAAEKAKRDEEVRKRQAEELKQAMAKRAALGTGKLDRVCGNPVAGGVLGGFGASVAIDDDEDEPSWRSSKNHGSVPQYKSLGASAPAVPQYKSLGASAPEPQPSASLRSLSAVSEDAYGPSAAFRGLAASVEEAEVPRYNACSASSRSMPSKPVLGACTLSVGDVIGKSIGLRTPNLRRNTRVPIRGILVDIFSLTGDDPQDKEIEELAEHREKVRESMGGYKKLADTAFVVTPFEPAAVKAVAAFAADKGPRAAKESDGFFSFAD